MKKTIILCILMLLLNACDVCNDTTERSGIDQLNDRHQQWTTNSIDSYVLRYKVYCFCPIELTEITVTNGEISQIVFKNDIGEVTKTIPSDEYDQYHTVSGLFALIEDIDSSADKLLVEYDATLGFPTIIDVDPHASRCSCDGSCSDVSDDEYKYEISLVVN